MKDTIYKGVQILAYPEVDEYVFCVGGWCYRVSTLTQAKTEIDEWDGSPTK